MFFLKEISLEDLQQQETWKNFTTLVRVLPDADILPVRAKYGVQQDASYTIGKNYLTLKEPLWFTMADCIASKLRTGKSPHVIEAIRFTSKPIQTNLRPI